MTALDAIAADRAGDIKRAAAAYEDALTGSERSLDLLLNLALLYWQATDPGVASAHGLEPDFLALAGRRFPELLRDALRLFPNSTEVRFWSKYIPWADLGEHFDYDECRRLLREDPTVLVPAMYLFAATHGIEADAKARELLRKWREHGTTRARYVVSVIEGVITRAGYGR